MRGRKKAHFRLLRGRVRISLQQHNPRSPFELESEPTEILAKAQTFVNSLKAIVIHRGQRQGPCPYCKSDFVKRHGTRLRKVRGHAGKHTINVQRWRCCICRRTWSEPIPGVAPFMRYSRAVIRKALDMYVFGGCSYRIVAQMLRSEINGTERARHWDPEGLEWPELPENRKIRLSHTSIWSWLQEAGRRANKDENRFGEIRQSGIWVADSTLGKVRDLWVGVLGVADGVSRVVFETVRIVSESEDEVLRKFARLRGFGVNTKDIKGLVSDGAEAYRLVLEGVMKRVAHQRCIFHLWRNIGVHIRRLKETKGEESAAAFKKAVRGVWDAASYEEARLGLEALKREWSMEQCVAPAVWLIEMSFEEATTHLKGIVEGMPRTSNVVEWLWRGYKRRVRLMGQFMSAGGMDSFNGVWALHVNFQRYQKRKERKRSVNTPGHCPVEMAGGQVGQLSWMDVLGI